MKLKTFKITNFRGYKEETVIDFDNLTAFVGKNDVGKSSILEALYIFFHGNEKDSIVKIDQADLNVSVDHDQCIILSACFTELPEEIIIDDTVKTSLQEEYMLNSEKQLEIIKKFKNGKSSVFIKAKHPTNKSCQDLLTKKNKELKDIIKEFDIPCNSLNINSTMRKAIWEHFQDALELNDIEIDVTKEDAKNIWAQLSRYIPEYVLFQSDRKNSDGDSEIQDPLKIAVTEILKDSELQSKLKAVAEEVVTKLQDVSNRTLDKLREMDPTIADSLNPVITAADKLKWQDVFKNVSISGDDNIPINKRGSGVRRLILLNFFRAEAERRMSNTKSTGIIYAIEEPETSQHNRNQKILTNAFKQLCKSKNTQVLLTTHSSYVVKQLDYSNIRVIKDSGNKKNCC